MKKTEEDKIRSLIQQFEQEVRSHERAMERKDSWLYTFYKKKKPTEAQEKLIKELKLIWEGKTKKSLPNPRTIYPNEIL